jgi:hypothetical protein
MSKEIIISEETLKMLISMAHQEGYKLAHQTLSDLNIENLSNKLADVMVQNTNPLNQNKDER